MQLHQSVTFTAFYLLQCSKAWFPMAKGSSGHQLFISAFILSKIICDNTYSNKSWCIIGQGMFALWEINQMGCEMCSHLEWWLNANPSMLCDFTYHIQQDFTRPGPYLPMDLPQPALVPFIHQSLSSATSGSRSAMPSLAPHVPMPKDAPVIPSLSIPTCTSLPSDTQATHLALTSPASLVLSQMPPNVQCMLSGNPSWSLILVLFCCHSLSLIFPSFNFFGSLGCFYLTISSFLLICLPAQSCCHLTGLA